MPPKGQIEKANISNTRYCIGTVRYLTPPSETAVRSIYNTDRGRYIPAKQIGCGYSGSLRYVKDFKSVTRIYLKMIA